MARRSCQAQNLSYPAACRCRHSPSPTAPSTIHHPTPSSRSSSPVCDLLPPATHAEAFGARLTEAFEPWRVGGLPVSALSDGFAQMKPWCRVWMCVIGGQIYVKAWRREGSDFKPELISGTRHTSALLGLAGTARRHKLPDVCALHSCLDMPIVPRVESALAPLVLSPPPPPPPPPSPSPLVLSFLSSDDHYDVPWPDYKHWGLPSANVPPWGNVRAAVLRAADALPFAARSRQLFANTAVSEGGVDRCAAFARPRVPCAHGSRLSAALAHRRGAAQAR